MVSVVNMTSSSAEQILIVESNNVSFENNKLNNFRTRLQREIILNGPHEIALLDATIPQQVFNVTDSNYFRISRYGLMKKGMSKRGCVIGDLNGWKCYLEYTVHCKIPAGYYGTVDDLMTTIAENVYSTIGQKDVKMIKTVTQMLVTSGKYENLGKCWYSKDTANIDDHINAIGGLKRIKFHKESQRVVIKPDQSRNSNQWRTQIAFSPDIAHILGFDKDHFLLSHNPDVLSYAPYISKISPEDTIYIYSNVINNIRVSNHEVQLLRALPFSYNSSEYGSNYFIEFNNAHFVELNTSRLSYLDFQLRGVTGNLVQFEDGHRHVRLTLKIRPCKSI